MLTQKKKTNNIEVGVHSDIGDIREINQDCILNKTTIVNGQSIGLFIVADGCGGVSYGEEISKLITTTFERLWDLELSALLRSEVVSDTNVNSFLEQTIFDINKNALIFSKRIGKRVGSTLSLLFIVGMKYYIKNLGDSRIYLIRKKNMQKLTEDQSLISDMLRNGELTLEGAKQYKRNILTMCIGAFEEIQIYSKSGVIRPGDMFLLCSDGLYNCLPEKYFSNNFIYCAQNKLSEKAKQLRNRIPQGKAKDNVSVVLVRFIAKKMKIRKWMVALLVLLMLLILVAGIFIFKEKGYI